MIFTRKFSEEDLYDKSIGNKIANKTEKRISSIDKGKDDFRAKSLDKIKRYDDKTDKYLNKSDKLAEKALDREEKAKFTRFGRFRRAIHSTKINPISYYHSRFREDFGKEGFTNGYDFRTQNKARKSEYYKAKADWNDRRVNKWNDYRKSKGYQTVKLKDRSGVPKDDIKDDSNSEVKPKFKNANDKAIEAKKSSLD